jgi:hypothetical protein
MYICAIMVGHAVPRMLRHICSFAAADAANDDMLLRLLLPLLLLHQGHHPKTPGG